MPKRKPLDIKPSTDAPPALLARADIEARLRAAQLPLSWRWVLAQQRAGLFPKPAVHLGQHGYRWRAGDVDRWLATLAGSGSRQQDQIA